MIATSKQDLIGDEEIAVRRSKRQKGGRDKRETQLKTGEKGKKKLQ